MFIGTQADRFVVGHVLGVQMLGQYAVATMLAQTPAQAFVRVITSLALPLVSRATDSAQRIKAKNGILLACLIASIVFSLIIAASGRFILTALYGSDFKSAIGLFQLLGYVQCVRIVQAAPTLFAIAEAKTAVVGNASTIRLAAFALQTLLLFSTGSVDQFLYAALLGEVLILAYLFVVDLVRREIPASLHAN